MHRLVGKAECWKGSALYCSNTSFPCTQAKVTRCMIYLAQGKQLFRGSAGVFRQSCSVPEESHLQMLTASFYPLPASGSPAVISPSGCAADASGSHSALTSAFTSISSSSWDCLALRVTSPPLSNLGDYFWVSHSVWAKELQQHCGIKNKPPTTTLWGFAACPGAGETSLRDLCQQLCAQCSAQTLCQFTFPTGPVFPPKMHHTGLVCVAMTGGQPHPYK